MANREVRLQNELKAYKDGCKRLEERMVEYENMLESGSWFNKRKDKVVKLPQTDKKLQFKTLRLS